MDNVTREEYQRGMDRIHQRIDSIGKSVERQETIVERVEKAVDKIFLVMYGNGKDGLTSKITRLYERVSLHTKLIVPLIISILTGFVGVIFWFFKGKL